MAEIANMTGVSGINFNSNVFKGVGLLGKAVWELSEGQTQNAITDFFAGIGLFGTGNAIANALAIKGMQPPVPGEPLTKDAVKK